VACLALQWLAAGPPPGRPAGSGCHASHDSSGPAERIQQDSGLRTQDSGLSRESIDG
jgi:hypothetical protein